MTTTCVTKIKPKQPFSETMEYVTWDYTEKLILDRESETLEHIQNIGSGCMVSRKYYVQDGVENLLMILMPRNCSVISKEIQTM